MDEFAQVCEDIARHASRNRKIQILAEYLRKLNDEDFALAVQYLSAGPVASSDLNHSLFDTSEKPKLSIGYSVLRDALQRATGWDKETLSICHTETGDTGETVSLLIRGISAGQQLSLQKADAIYQELFRARRTEQRLQMVVDVFKTYAPLALKYFVKVITRGLRVGLMARMLEEAVAQACDVPHSAIRDANNRLGDLSRVALAARRGELEAIEARLFHSMEFMLAKPLDRLEDLASPSDWIVEDKYDGIRSQVHFENGRVQIFSRGMEDLTSAFPEIETAFARFTGRGIVDGEILAWRDRRALSFNVLQQRIARKRVRAVLQQTVPVVFVAYDLLLRDETLLFQHPFEERRAQLEQLFGSQAEPLLLSGQHRPATLEEVEDQFRAARERGNEGLLLKRRGSLYEPGKRSGQWMKLKRPYGTLDVVVTAAEQGSGRRAIFFSDYTFAVRSSEGYVNVGKAYSGLTDSEVKELTRVLRSASTEKFGRVILVRPEVVLEVAFDGVQKSPRHKSGYALRFPRILRWRRDKKPEESDEIGRVQALYEDSIQ